MSVILVTRDNYASIRLTALHIAAQTVRESIELVIAAPSRATLGLIESDLTGLHSYQVVEVGEFLERGDAGAPAVRAARGPIIGITENHAFPDPTWAEVLIEAHKGPWAAVCPVVDIFNPETLVSRTERLIDYGTWIAHDKAGEIDRVPWHNTSYKRDLMMQFDKDLEAMMEPEDRLQHALKAQGHRFYIEPRARTRHVSDSMLSSALSAMFGRGRIFGASRSREWSVARKLVYVLASPVFPFIRLYQLRENIARFNRQYPAYKLMPMTMFLLYVIAAGECAGYLAGVGGSHDWLARHELDIELRANPRDIDYLKNLLQERLAAA